MKIVDLRCAVIGRHPIVRIVTDENIYGLGEVEFTKPYIKPWVLALPRSAHRGRPDGCGTRDAEDQAARQLQALWRGCQRH